MSRIFGVTTDYLLKDELGEQESSVGGEKTALRRGTLEEASAYLLLRKKAAPQIAFAAFLCIISPVCLLFPGGLSEESAHLSENAAMGIGMIVLLALVAAGAAVFLSCGSRTREYEFLEKEAFETEYGVTGMVKERKAAWKESYTRLNIAGAVLCILGVIPIFVFAVGGESAVAGVISVCAAILIEGIGCMAFIYGGVYTKSLKYMGKADEEKWNAGKNNI